MARSGANRSAKSADGHWTTVPCFMCTNQCGLNVCVEDGRVTEIRGMKSHPRSKGGTCVKGRHIVDYMYHENRLKYPMKKANGGWQRITWDEALDTIATKWQRAKEQYGPASCSVFLGEPACLTIETGWFMAWRLCDLFGTPSRFEPLDLCGTAMWMATLGTFGYLTEPDMENSGCIILWATNPHASDPIGGVLAIEAARKKGAKLIVIDPRRTPFARKADVHIKPNLGTDGYLALAMINVIISEQLYDKEFISKHTVGFDQLVQHARNFTLEEAERICGVPVADIRQAARLYATSHSGCIRHYFRPGFMPDGVHNYRSFAILAALTGNIDRPGGELTFGFAQFAPSTPVRLREKLGDAKWVGQDKFPLFSKYLSFFKDGSMTNFSDSILCEPQQVRNMILCGTNPAVSSNNTAKVKEALSKLDFLVSLDVVMTESNKLADIVLPSTVAFERLNFSTYHGEFIGRQLVEPYHEAKSEFTFWSELGRRMGYGEYFPWQTDVEAMDYFFAPHTVENLLKEHPDGYLNWNVLPGARRYEQNGFPTPSGKLELYSETFRQYGYDPLPTYRGPTVSPTKTPQVFEEYPLQLISGFMEVEYWHSMYHQVDVLRKRAPGMFAEIHPATAAQYGIRDGQPMVIETSTGSVETCARVTRDITPGMVAIPAGWEGNNLVTNDATMDPISGVPECTGLLCRVRPAAGHGKQDVVAVTGDQVMEMAGE